MKKYKYVYGEETIEFSSLSTVDADRFYSILKDSKDPDAEEFVFNQITNSKYNLEDIPAGIVIAVIFASIKLSGVIKNPIDLPNKIEQARDQFDEDIILTFHSVILRYMPSYTPDMLKQKTLNEIIELLTMAERISGQQAVDIDKMKEALCGIDKKAKKGIAGTSKEEIGQIKSMLDKLEGMGGFPN
jgi:hypothetical protein